MKDKCFELLKELLLEQTAGAFNILDEPIGLAIDIYCEMTNTDRIQFTTQLSSIGRTVWGGEPPTNDDWKEKQATYEKMIDLLKK